MSYAEIGILVLAGFLSSVIKNGVGIGSGIFLLPVLSLQFPAKIALALGAPIMLASDCIGLRNYWREWVGWREIARLLVPAVPGLVLGTLLIPVIPGHMFRVAVGVFGVCYALVLLFPQFPAVIAVKRLFPVVTKANEGKCAMCYGFAGGMATVLAHAGGVVWSMFLMITVRDKRVFVATIVLLFFITNILKLISYLSIGILDLHMCLVALSTFPAIVLGSWLGNTMNKKINQHLFRQMVLITIFVVSLSLIVGK